jgi:hypothetical protein
MDLVTQQNAAMVEEAAAAAADLERQSDELENLVAQFVLNESRTATKAFAQAMPARTFPAASAASDNAKWETF